MSKKLTSLMMALAVSASLIPSNVMAEGEAITLKGFNATKSVITLDFESAEVAQEVTDFIVYKKGDAGIVTLESNEYAVTRTDSQNGLAADGTTEMTTAEGNTVIIEPNGGIDTTAFYKIEVSGITTGWFKVNQLFFDNFDYAVDTEAQTAEYPYYWYNNKVYSKWWTNGQNSDGGSRYQPGTYATYTNQNAYNSLICTNNAGNTTLSSEALSEFPALANLKDYTIEYDYKLPGSNQNRTTASLRMRASSQNTGYGIVLGSSNEKQFHNKSDAPVLNGQIALQSGASNLAVIPSYAVVDDELKIRMSTIDDNIQYFIDDDKLFDINDSTVTAGGKLWLTDNTLCGQWYKPSTIDNFSITTVTKLGDVDLSGGAIEFKGFNATASVVTADFTNVNVGFDTTDIKDYIAITSMNIDGTEETEITDFEVNVSDEQTGTDASGNAVKTALANTIIITPVNGINPDKIYNVVFKQGLSDLTGNTLEAVAETGFFKVNQLFFDNFDYAVDTEAQTAEYPYYWYNNKVYSKWWTNGQNSDGGSRYQPGTYATSTNQNAYNSLICTNNAGNTTLSSEALSEFPALANLKDYTIEYDYKLPGSNQNRTTASLRMRAASSSTGYGVVLGTSTENQFYNGALSGKIALQSGASNLAVISSYAVVDDELKIRMSTIDDNIQYFIDDDKLFDINDSTVTAGGKLWLTDNTLCGQWYKPSTIDNFSITTVTLMSDIPATADIVSYNADTEAVYLKLGDLGLADNEIVDFNGITLKDKTGAVVTTEVSAENGTIVIKPQNDLKCNEKYTISATDLMTTYGTSITNYTKDFQVVKVWEESFDTEASVIQEADENGWTTTWTAVGRTESVDHEYNDDGTIKTNNAALISKSVFSWDNGIMKIKSYDLPASTSGKTSYLLDRINTRTQPKAAVRDYTTKFDLHIYDNTKLGQFLFYTNKEHRKQYNEDGMNFELRNNNFALNHWKSYRNTAISSYTPVKAEINWGVNGGTYTIKDMKSNGTGKVTINSIEQLVYDYSAYELMNGGYLGFSLQGDGVPSEIGIDNILITYAADWVTGENSTPDEELVLVDAKAVNSGEDIVATAEILCNKNIGSYTVIAAAYDNTGKLLGVKTQAVSSYSLGVARETSVTISGAAGAYETKIMVWDSIKGMKALVSKKI